MVTPFIYVNSSLTPTFQAPCWDSYGASVTMTQLTSAKSKPSNRKQTCQDLGLDERDYAFNYATDACSYVINGLPILQA